MTKGAFFHHYACKEDLATAPARFWGTRSDDMFVLPACDNPAQKLLDYIDMRAAMMEGPVFECACLAGNMVQEWHAGGRTICVIRGPDGEEHRDEGVFLEVTPGVQFVSTDAVTRNEQGEWQTSGPFMAGIWETAPEGDGTRYTATALHWTEAACKDHDEMGFTQGWRAAADQLAALCEKGEL